MGALGSTKISAPLPARKIFFDTLCGVCMRARVCVWEGLIFTIPKFLETGNLEYSMGIKRDSQSKTACTLRLEKFSTCTFIFPQISAVFIQFANVSIVRADGVARLYLQEAFKLLFWIFDSIGGYQNCHYNFIHVPNFINLYFSFNIIIIIIIIINRNCLMYT